MRAVLGTVKRHQDRFAGAFVGTIGLLTAGVSATYPVGTLRAMGPGFFPLLLGVVLAGVGGMIALAGPSIEADPHDAEGLDHPEPRGWLCIIGGIATFLLLAERAGMLPATFACVFIAAMGDRTATWRGSFVLAACISVAGVLLFHYGLKIQLPPVNW